MKLIAKQQRELETKLKHILGICNCKCSSTTCAYWKHIDGKDPDWQIKMIVREVKKCIS